jgi:hypothetical protein
MGEGKVGIHCDGVLELLIGLFVHYQSLAGVYWEWNKKKRKFVILCGATGTILYYARPLQ